MDTLGIFKRAAEKTGFNRVRYVESNVPTAIEKVTIMPFLGDLRSTFILSSLLLRRVKEELKASKYFILASWPGYESLFPYVDEYWSIKDDYALEKFRNATKGFENMAPGYTLLNRELNHHFCEVMTWDALKPYYNDGIQQAFFDRFKHVKVNLPDVPSAASLGNDFIRVLGKKSGHKVFLYPTKKVDSWRMGHVEPVRASKEFWMALVEELLKNNFVPVLYKDATTHDLSADFTDDCIHIWESSIFKVMGAMRHCGCVLDVFNSISRLAIASRTPFVMVDERARHVGVKESEIDDLCARNLPREYIFGFATIIDGGGKFEWKSNLFDNIIARLNSFLPELDRDSWPSTAASYEVVPYEQVRRNKKKRMGTRFIKIPRD
jgi:hypothetical protein